MRARLSVWGALFVAVAASTPDVRFVDATKAAGIAFAHKNSATSNKYLIETMGGGVALLDYDNDGRLDIFLTNGARLDDPMPAGKRPDKSDAAFWNRLYRQTPDGTFVDATEKAGLTGMPQDQYGMGVAVGDYDNDGFEDLYVTNYGANTLYHNNGNGTFTDVTNRAGVAAGGWSASAGFFDYDNDGKLDLFVTRYVDWSFQNNRYCGEKKPGYRAYCHPDNYDGRDEHPVSTTTATARSPTCPRRPGSPTPSGKGLGVAFADYDDDGFMDVYVANDSVQSFLFHNNGNGTFTEVGLLAGVGFNEDGKTFAGMGVDFADYDNDGRPDIVVTDLSNERYRLFRQNGDGSFRDVTNATGVGGATLLVFRMEHAVRRLRQRRLERHLRRAGARHGHDREDLAQPEVPAAAIAAAQRVGAIRASRCRRRVPTGMGRPRRRLRRSGQRRRHRCRAQQRRAERRRAAERGREPESLAGDPNGGHQVESRRHRLPGEGVHGVRADAVLHRQDGRRLSVGERQAADRSVSVAMPSPRSSRFDGRRAWCRGSRTSRQGRRSRPQNLGNDDPSRVACAAGVLRARRLRAGRLVARGQAATARQALGPSVSGAVHGRGEARPV